MKEDVGNRATSYEIMRQIPHKYSYLGKIFAKSQEILTFVSQTFNYQRKEKNYAYRLCRGARTTEEFDTSLIKSVNLKWLPSKRMRTEIQQWVLR